jgi:hypothetical protein
LTLINGTSQIPTDKGTLLREKDKVKENTGEERRGEEEGCLIEMEAHGGFCRRFLFWTFVHVFFAM